MVFDIDGVHLNQAVGEGLADAMRVIFVRGDLGWNAVAQNDAVSTLHQIKRRADDGRVFAQEINFGRGRKVRVDRFEDMKFANHVVRFGSNGAQRSPAQDIFARADVEEVGQVRVTAGELLDFDAGVDAGEFSAQKSGQGTEVQFFAVSHGGGVGHQN